MHLPPHSEACAAVQSVLLGPLILGEQKAQIKHIEQKKAKNTPAATPAAPPTLKSPTVDKLGYVIIRNEIQMMRKEKMSLGVKSWALLTSFG